MAESVTVTSPLPSPQAARSSSMRRRKAVGDSPSAADTSRSRWKQLTNARPAMVDPSTGSSRLAIIRSTNSRSRSDPIRVVMPRIVAGVTGRPLDRACGLSPTRCVLLEPGLDDLLHERGRDRFFCRETECSFPREVWLQLFPQCPHDRVACGEEAAVVFERGVGNEESTMMLECRHLVADRFGRLGRGGLDRLPNLRQSGARSFWKGGQVFLDVRGCSHAGSSVRESGSSNCSTNVPPRTCSP